MPTEPDLTVPANPDPRTATLPRRAANPSARRIGIRILAAVLALVAAVLMMGVIDLGTLLGLSDQRYQWPVSLDVSWGSLFTFQIAGSYAWIAFRPHRVLPAVAQLLVTAVALTVAAAAGSDVRPLWVGAVVALTALLFARLARVGRIASRIGRPLRWRLLLLAAAGVALWLPYSLHAFAISSSDHEPYITNDIDHWPVQGATGIALAVCVLVLAFWPPARELLRGTVALSAALIGIAMLAYPERGGATEPELWGIAVVVWAVLLALTPSTGGPALRAEERERSVPDPGTA